jgi:transposase
MPRPYSNDLRARVIEAIEAGASRREAADRYELSPSVVVLWAQRWEETGSIAAKPSGGSTSPLEEHAEFLLGLIVEQPDLTLDEIVAAMRKKASQAAAARCGGSLSDGTSASKKTLYAAEQKRAEIARARRRWMRQQGMFDAARLVFIDETWTSTSMVRLRGRCRRGERLIGYAPQGHWKVITFVAGLRERAMVAPFVLEGAMNGPMFLAYVRQCVVPILKRGEIVISIIFQPTKWLASGRRSKRRVRRCFTSHRIRQTSTRSSRPSANSRRTYARQLSAPFRAFCVGSVAPSVVSAHKNAGTSSGMQATFKRDRNPL